MKYLTVRAAAESLGVHENTIRRWEAQGIIPAIRLPGSNFRRFRPEDVERLGREMTRRLERDHSADATPEDATVVSGSVDESLWES